MILLETGLEAKHPCSMSHRVFFLLHYMNTARTAYVAWCSVQPKRLLSVVLLGSHFA